LVAAHSGKCLEVAGGSTADGGVVHQWDCHGGTNQQWRVSTPGSEPPPPPPPPPACGYTWYATKTFVPDEHYTGCNGTLYMQLDGNLVIYAPSGIPLWASNTCCISGAYAVFQDDGNLVVYARGAAPCGAAPCGRPTRAKPRSPYVVTVTLGCEQVGGSFRSWAIPFGGFF
jgi:hypothetical protein